MSELLQSTSATEAQKQATRHQPERSSKRSNRISETLIYEELSSAESSPIRRGRSRRRRRTKYNKIDDSTRVKMLDCIKDGQMTIREASKNLNINYSTAKTIYAVYRKEGRIKRKIQKTIDESLRAKRNQAKEAKRAARQALKLRLKYIKTTAASVPSKSKERDDKIKVKKSESPPKIVVKTQPPTDMVPEASPMVKKIKDENPVLTKQTDNKVYSNAMQEHYLRMLSVGLQAPNPAFFRAFPPTVRVGPHKPGDAPGIWPMGMHPFYMRSLMQTQMSDWHMMSRMNLMNAKKPLIKSEDIGQLINEQNQHRLKVESMKSEEA